MWEVLNVLLGPASSFSSCIFYTSQIGHYYLFPFFSHRVEGPPSKTEKTKSHKPAKSRSNPWNSSSKPHQTQTDAISRDRDR